MTVNVEATVWNVEEAKRLIADLKAEEKDCCGVSNLHLEIKIKTSQT